MDHQAVLAYLNDFVNDPRVVAYEDLSESERQVLPPSWQNILSVQGPERLRRILACWETYKPDFDDLVEYLKLHLLDVELIHHDGIYALLYVVRAGQSGKQMYYETRNPLTKTMAAVIEAAWPKFPDTFLRFYEFHNGWYHLASQAMGPSPTEIMFALSEEDWGILEDIGPHPST